MKKDDREIGPPGESDPGAAEQTGRREALPLRITAVMDLVYSESRNRQEATELPDRELALRARGGDLLHLD